ncbi:substrate-binding periplasmic protein [Aeromonas enteropelogenes]|uniref:substrate-binding periplasmic protein n=1 Tax=Aeromonas enteropelogenes TaxID=29489 RepID=UPI0022855F25|nr:transporter substrate-binding domain-containing protein [Aeromonas enteropelogenes]MCZ0751621.1 transporter substrate-binding domain-containing protein [Aeromonas enteropelogenes]
MKWTAYCLLLCCWMPQAFSASLCPAPLRVGFDNWPPYHYYDDGDARQQVHGFAVETLNGVLARIGCQANYVELPWKRVLHEIELGKLDMAMEVYFNEDRARYGYFSDTYNPGRTLLWVRKGQHYHEQDLASWLVSGHKLGVTKDYFYGDEVMALLAYHSAQVSTVNDEQNYGKLVLGRIDGFLGDMLATPWGLKEQGLAGQIVPHGKPVHELPTFFLFSKKRFSPDFIARFNQELAAFKVTSEYDAIWRRYVSPELAK